jgi:hypothetical protein
MSIARCESTGLTVVEPEQVITEAALLIFVSGANRA